jgi:two-component system sensor kinase FixL
MQPEQGLRASEATLRAVLSTTDNGVLTLARDGLIEAANAGAATMFRGQLVGLAFGALVEPGCVGLPEAGCVHALVGQRRDGSTFPMEVVLTRIESNVRAVVIAVLRDVTEQRRLDKEVLDASAQLQRQIGHDLHDGLGQLLTGTAFLAKSLQSRVREEDQPQAQRVVELINQAINRVRSLARGLAPIHVGSQGLGATLRQVVQDSGKLLGVTGTLRVTDDAADLEDDIAAAHLSLITREAITNAVRHGAASRVDVTLTKYGDTALLAIRDDGTGIDVGTECKDGVGLRSMRDRAAALGGRLEVSRLPRGTLVRMSWNASLSLRPKNRGDNRSSPSGR